MSRDLDAAYDALMEGDLASARRLVASHLAAHPDDAPALELRDLVADLRQDFPEYPLACLACGAEGSSTRRALLNTRLWTFLGKDEAERQGLCLVCDRCGYIHWFLPTPAVGVFQALKRPDLLEALLAKARQAAADPGTADACYVCGSEEASSQRVLLNTRAMALLELDWLERAAEVRVCARCGFLRWSVAAGAGAGRDGLAPPAAPPRPPLRDTDLGKTAFRCLGCGGDSFARRSLLLNGPMRTAWNLEWASRGAGALTCLRCGDVDWFRHESPFLR